MTTPGADGGWASPSGYVGPPPGYVGPPPGSFGPPPGYPAPPQRWGAPYQPLDLRPGIVPLRPLAVGDVLDGSLTLLRRYFRPVIAVSVIVAIVVQALGFLITTANADSDSTGLGILYFFLTLLVSQVGGLILAGPVSALAGEAVLGRPMSLQEVLAKTRPRAGAIALTAFLVALIAVVGIPFLAIPFAMAIVYYAFSTQAAVLEKLPTRRAMSRSVSLVKGSFWRILGILVLASIIAGVVALVLEIPTFVIADVATGHLFTSAAGASSLTSRGIIAVGGAIAGMFTLPFIAGVHSLLYMDMRMRKEGLDVALRQAASTSQRQAASTSQGQAASGSQPS